MSYLHAIYDTYDSFEVGVTNLIVIDGYTKGD